MEHKYALTGFSLRALMAAVSAACAFFFDIRVKFVEPGAVTPGSSYALCVVTGFVGVASRCLGLARRLGSIIRIRRAVLPTTFGVAKHPV